MTDTLAVTPILSGACGCYAPYHVKGWGHANPIAYCAECDYPTSVTYDIAPYMDEGETLVSQSHPSGVSVLGYVTREGE